jgi:hypothetical protein
VVLRTGQRVTALKQPDENGVIIVELGEIVVDSRADPPLELVNTENVEYPAATSISIARGKPLPNGMHMTQFDMWGMCHGGAHPALEQRLRAEGRMAVP